jgi:hypothetical protein
MMKLSPNNVKIVVVALMAAALVLLFMPSQSNAHYFAAAGAALAGQVFQMIFLRCPPCGKSLGWRFGYKTGVGAGRCPFCNEDMER